MALVACLLLGLLAPSADAAARRSASNPFDGTGMWIWVASRSSGGSPAAIGAKARRYGIRTVFLKSSDGPYMWTQFSRSYVAALKAQGLKVCGWQYVYGRAPETEAKLGATAVTRGADCLVIDAESEYEGRYAQADRYIRALRARIGSSYPLGVAPFPYVDYHLSFPYSVFLGPNGAQYNLPQMYWKAIGTSVDAVFSHTYTYNRLFGRRIYPLGQLYENPSPSSIARFRTLATAYGASGVNWWDWQETTTRGWNALVSPLTTRASAPRMGYPTLRRGARGDLVVWAQQHLVSAGFPVKVDGGLGTNTRAALLRFQAAKGVSQTGAVDAATWPALLRYAATAVAWGRKASARTSSAASASGGASRPASAHIPAREREIPPKVHGRG
ncbi:MAG TPA: peptidoglycan-binding domain-containing protein [Solirubrobacteraceae bacterium]|nr:peptidoglycan-binding domain-containing protein [Solirubrobacteraceae bacterium]